MAKNKDNRIIDRDEKRAKVMAMLIVTLLVDAVIFGAMLTRTTADGIATMWRYWIMPLVMLVLDVAFTVLSANVNYRFKYSLKLWIPYAVLRLGMTAIIGMLFFS